MFAVVCGISVCALGGPIDQPIMHKVQPGETLWKISQRYNVPLNQILDANSLKNADKIVVNQIIVIPQVSEPATTQKPAYSKDQGIFHELQRGQTVWDLSKMYQVPVKTIIEANNISSPKKLKVGQLILIPMTAERQTEFEEGRTFERYVEQLVKLPARQKLRDWKYIVIHHSATDMGNAASFEYYHRYKRHMQNGLAYHFVITNGHRGSDGGIEVGSRWQKQLHGGHVRSDFYNNNGIGICLVGNFQNYPPSIKQLESLRALVQVLKDMCGIPSSNVMGHGELDTEHSLCPGKFLPLKRLRSQLR